MTNTLFCSLNRKKNCIDPRVWYNFFSHFLVGSVAPGSCSWVLSAFSPLFRAFAAEGQFTPCATRKTLVTCSTANKEQLADSAPSFSGGQSRAEAGVAVANKSIQRFVPNVGGRWRCSLSFVSAQWPAKMADAHCVLQHPPCSAPLATPPCPLYRTCNSAGEWLSAKGENLSDSQVRSLCPSMSRLFPLPASHLFLVSPSADIFYFFAYNLIHHSAVTVVCIFRNLVFHWKRYFPKDFIHL